MAVENGTIYDQNLILTSYVALLASMAYNIPSLICAFQRSELEQDCV